MPVWYESTCQKYMPEDMSEHMSDFTAGQMSDHTPLRVGLTKMIKVTVQGPSAPHPQKDLMNSTLFFAPRFSPGPSIIYVPIASGRVVPQHCGAVRLCAQTATRSHPRGQNSTSSVSSSQRRRSNGESWGGVMTVKTGRRETRRENSQYEECNM